MKLVFVAFASVLCASAARAGDESLLPLRSMTGYLGASDLFTADLDGNGRKEVLTLASDSEGVPVYLNRFDIGPNGDVISHSTMPLPVGREAGVADFDGDGFDDVAFIDWSIKVYRGAPTGVPTLWQTLQTNPQIEPYCGAVADLDNDGWPDIMVGQDNVTSNTPYRILRNTAGTGFETKTPLTGMGMSPRDLTVADVNLDGLLDVVGAEGEVPGVRVLLGKPGGLLMTNKGLMPTDNYPMQPRVLDLTGDGLPDLAYTIAAYLGGPGMSGGVRCRAGTGGGNFGPEFATPADTGWGSLAVGDVDADGDEDLLLGSYGQFTYLYENVQGALPLAAPTSLRTIIEANFAHMSDLNGDDLPDLVAGDGKQFSIACGGPQGLALPKASPLIDLPVTLDSADFTGDGLNDVLSLGGNDGSQLALADGLGDGDFGAPVLTSLPSSPTGRQVTIAELNGDALPDVLVLSTTSSVSSNLRLAMSNGASKTFTAGKTVSASGGPAASTLVADLDGDGEAEICQPLITGRVRVWHLDATLGFTAVGTFSAGAAATTPFGAWDRSTAGDLDEDGFLDLVYPIANEGSIFVLPGQAGGSLGTATVIADAEAAHANCVYVVDVNEDGLNDLLATSQDNRATVWAGQPGMSFAAPQTQLDGPTHSRCADIDADGHLDLIGLRDYAGPAAYSYELQVQRGLGNGQFLPPLTFATTGSRLAVADLSTDGILDVVVSGTENGAFSEAVEHPLVYVTQPYTKFTDLGYALGGSHGDPEFFAWGWLKAGQTATFSVARAKPLAPAGLFIGLSQAMLPFKGGTLVPSIDVLLPMFVTDSKGRIELGLPWPASVPSGLSFTMQWWFADATGPAGFTASNALTATTP